MQTHTNPTPLGLKVHPRALLLPSPLTEAKRLRNRARHIAKLIVYVYTRMHIYMQTHTNPTPLGLKVHPRALLLSSPFDKAKRLRNRARHTAKLIVYVYTRMHIYRQTHTNPTPLGLKVHPKALLFPSPLTKVKRFRNRAHEI